jgi:hypothetical protein
MKSPGISIPKVLMSAELSKISNYGISFWANGNFFRGFYATLEGTHSCKDFRLLGNVSKVIGPLVPALGLRPFSRAVIVNPSVMIRAVVIVDSHER